MFNIDIKDLIPTLLKNNFQRKFNSKTFDKYAYKIWINLIDEVLKNNNIIDKRHIRFICYSPSLDRLFYKLFYAYKAISINEIAINFAFELQYHHVQIKSTYIIQFSKAIRERIIEEILENTNLKEKLERKFDIKVDDYILNNINELMLKELLENKLKLRQEYFKSYSTYNENDELIKVYLPNAHEYIDWAKGPFVLVYINSYKKIEKGFFRVGYDYRLMETNEHLRFATLSKDKPYEVAEFSTTKIGDLTDDYIWAL
ncbi:hypothetical protein ABU162_26640 [Paenibacillus thiaminolyticus]|uniref:hypothetical protein n=1 Tax=Paenibacillus thiaminolyticus TaxID=49283 RepID=UPI0035A6CCA9